MSTSSCLRLDSQHQLPETSGLRLWLTCLVAFLGSPVYKWQSLGLLSFQRILTSRPTAVVLMSRKDRDAHRNQEETVRHTHNNKQFHQSWWRHSYRWDYAIRIKDEKKQHIIVLQHMGTKSQSQKEDLVPMCSNLMMGKEKHKDKRFDEWFHTSECSCASCRSLRKRLIPRARSWEHCQGWSSLHRSYEPPSQKLNRYTDNHGENSWIYM